jgi:hypothetical protein
LALTLCGCFAPTHTDFGDAASDDDTTSDDGGTGPVADDDDGDDDDDDDDGNASSITDTTPTSTTLTGAGEDSTGDDSDADSGTDDDGASSDAGSDDGDDLESSSSDDTSSDDGSAATCTSLSSDLDTVALWHFDDAMGQVAVDASGNGRDLQLGPTAGSDSADPVFGGGAFEGGLSFTNADEDYATSDNGNTFPTNELTVEFWVRSTSTNYAQLFTAGFINCFVAMIDNGGGVEFGIGNGNDWEFLRVDLPAGTYNDGAWHYIAATYDGDTMRAYADGVEIGSGPATTALADPGDYKVGGRPFNTFLDGDMDDVRLSDVARGSDEIAAAYAGCE